MVDQEIRYTNMPYTPVKWCSVKLSDVIKAGCRLEAAVFCTDALTAVETIKSSKYGSLSLKPNKNGFVKAIYHAPRFKRNYITNRHPNAVAFIGSSEMLDIYPIADKYITSELAQSKKLYIKKNTVLMSCSGTIGNVTLGSNALLKFALSQHIIRLECDLYPGYLYICLKSNLVQAQIQSLVYGKVILEIEPHHLEKIIIPNASDKIKSKINNLILRSFELRDKSNELIDKATAMLVAELKLPPLHEIKTEQFDKNTNVNNYTVKLSELNGRLDGSYHIPIAKAIVKHLQKYAAEVTTVGNKRVSKDIILAGIFKRTYVEEGYGIPFLGGKEITQLIPKTEKYLSRIHHSERYGKELKVNENNILVTDRGTIGIVSFVPKHWGEYAVSQNVIKLVPTNDEIAGYLFVYLNSIYGKLLVQQQTYGSVVDMIDNNSLAVVPFPLLKNIETQTEINCLALEANRLRYKAYLLEQEAMTAMNDEVLLADSEVDLTKKSGGYND